MTQVDTRAGVATCMEAAGLPRQSMAQIQIVSISGEKAMNHEPTCRAEAAPASVKPAGPSPSSVDDSEEAKKSPAFREALRKDDEREKQADFHPDRDVWGRTGAGPDAKKTDPMTSQAREEKKARRENGY
ncbi:hypothetical protein [Variovorax sp. UMC13]|uniref:hypothetical protein n=1 Tax=Variovorax sp. UMC13 TaxID=1862326 RepID=UPI001602D571|nr:hypothetical protein [Variovorax sp. UMC13]